MFHALSVLPHYLFHVPDLGCLVMMKRRGRRLHIFDIVAPEMPAFADLYPYLAEGRRDRVEFAFLPDQLDVSGLHGAEAGPTICTFCPIRRSDSTYGAS